MSLVERVSVLETDIRYIKESQKEIIESQKEMISELQRLNRFKWYLSGAAMAIGFFVTLLIELGRLIVEKQLNLK